ncbi:MAG: HEAT repeat domain-containing protein [Deltaproteobacteria bacterium]|nr:HEAT repeat domain-containing protein [Deltaproteobacteria bacterium]
MFDGLEEVSWGELTHAYGEASDVPALLRGMVSLDAEERAWGFDTFWGGPLHQGSVYTSTLASVPFLIEALSVPHTDREQLLVMLGAIGVGWTESHTGLPKSLADFNPGRTLELFGRRRFDHDERGLSRDCYLAVAQGCPAYLQLLADPRQPEGVRSFAANLLAWFPPVAFDARPVLQGLFADESGSESLRASAALALGHLGAPPALAPHGSPLLDVCVRIAVAAIRPRHEQQELLAPLTRAPVPEADPPWPWGSLSEALGRVGGETPDLLAEYLESPTETLRTLVMDRLFPPDRHPWMSTERPDRRIPGPEVSSWSETARTFLKSLADEPGLWPAIGETLRARLGLTFEPTPGELLEGLHRKGGGRRWRTLSTEETNAVLGALSDQSSDPMDAMCSLDDVVPMPPVLTAPLLELALGTDAVLATKAAWLLQRVDLDPARAERVLARVTRSPKQLEHLGVLVSSLGPAYFDRTLDLIRRLLDGDHPRVGGLFPSLEAVGESRVVDALQDEHPGIRSRACFELQGHLRSGGELRATTLEALLARCHDEDEGVRERARWAIDRAGAAVVPLLESADGSDVVDLLHGLGADITLDRVAEAVAGVLRHPDWRVRMAAIDALGQGEPSPACLDALVVGLSDSHEGPRELAAEVLGWFGTKAASAASHVAQADLPLTLALRTLARLGAFAPAESLLRTVARSTPDSAVERELHLTLHATMPAALELALELLDSTQELTPLQLWALAPCAPIDHPRVTSASEESSPVGTIARWLRSPPC